ncbi:uncharacterized transmembrane protein DDB_G0289901-like [Scaptodrosophila lebanonensis]|uniref:Uncharacterized transmembrane protein DDB_G0289901-like n=1 Tax=Drosophila lebanonensis TaxID=7225 RepID=A0A6J2UEX2_DROLE|nr:uncharacterized transmembrane protein DDB_G0289901-like [Scaptodrosophila lebanonensis]
MKSQQILVCFLAIVAVTYAGSIGGGGWSSGGGGWASGSSSGAGWASGGGSGWASGAGSGETIIKIIKVIHEAADDAGTQHDHSAGDHQAKIISLITSDIGNAGPSNGGWAAAPESSASGWNAAPAGWSGGWD